MEKTIAVYVPRTSGAAMIVVSYAISRFSLSLALVIQIMNAQHEQQ